MPAASAMSRTVVFLNPRCANSSAAIARSSSRRDALVVVCCVIDVLPLRSDCLGVLAADRDHLAGHVRRVVAGEEQHHVRDLPWLRRASEGLALLELCEQLV